MSFSGRKFLLVLFFCIFSSTLVFGFQEIGITTSSGVPPGLVYSTGQEACSHAVSSPSEPGPFECLEVQFNCRNTGGVDNWIRSAVSCTYTFAANGRPTQCLYQARCVQSHYQMQCEDSDGGINIGAPGYARATMNGENPLTLLDTCDGDVLHERFCGYAGPTSYPIETRDISCTDFAPASSCVTDDQGAKCTLATCGLELCDGIDNDCDSVIDDGYLCAYNQACRNGQCVDLPIQNPECYDSDGGQNVYTRGYTELGETHLFDVCYDDTTVSEQYCYSNNVMASTLLTCSGIGQSCVQGKCVQTCTPNTETCDGTDNDCDHQIDEGPSLCSGTQTCQNGQCVTTCTPRSESCNGIDDDCDGQVDEGSSLCTGIKTCQNGACRNPLICNFSEQEPNNYPGNPQSLDVTGCRQINIDADSPATDEDYFQILGYTGIRKNHNIPIELAYTDEEERAIDKVAGIFTPNYETIYVNDDTGYYVNNLLPSFSYFNELPMPFTVNNPIIAFANHPEEDRQIPYEIRITTNSTYNPIWNEDAKQQAVYINYEASNGVVIGHRDPVNINDFDESTIFSECGFSENQAEYLKRQITQKIRKRFLDYPGMQIYTSQETGGQPPNGEYTMLHIGAVYDEGLLGIANYLDEFNPDKTGTAIVFTDTFEAFCVLDQALNEMTTAIANVGAHEIGHTVGLYHSRDVEDIMDITANLSEILTPQEFKTAQLHEEVFPETGFFQSSPWYLHAILGTSTESVRANLCGGEGTNDQIQRYVTSDSNPSLPVFSTGDVACAEIGLPCTGIGYSCHNLAGGEPFWVETNLRCSESYPFQTDCVYVANCRTRAICIGQPPTECNEATCPEEEEEECLGTDCEEEEQIKIPTKPTQGASEGVPV